MNTLWEKIVFGAKVAIFGIVALYAICFIAANWGVNVPDISLVVRRYDEIPLEKVLFIDSVLSIAGWWLFWAVFRAIRRIKAASAAKTNPPVTPIAPTPMPPTTTTPSSGGNMPFTPPK